MKTNELIIYSAIVIIIIIIIVIIIVKYLKYYTNCKKMKKLYNTFPNIRNISPTTINNNNLKLRDFYIKTAYNACSAGNYKNDYVNICALKNVINQGVRCLDFEIYSIDDEPVVSTSTMDKYNSKETYNSISFSNVIKTINNYAFTQSECPNPKDPIIVHLRIKSENKHIYDKMSKIIYNSIEDRILGNKYSYEFQGNNLGSLPIKELMGKIIFIADKSNPLFTSTPLDEYVNLSSSSVFMRNYRYNDVKYVNDINELIYFNKKNMTLCIPDISIKPKNPSSALTMKFGCQMTAMSFQKKDTNLEYYNSFFNKNGHAFVLKPPELRYKDTTISIPKPPPKKLSYKGIKASNKLFDYTI